MPCFAAGQRNVVVAADPFEYVLNAIVELPEKRSGSSGFADGRRSAGNVLLQCEQLVYYCF